MSLANSPIKLNDGTTIPWLGFGTGTALYAKDAEKMVTAAIQSGLTHLDGAQIYGNEDSLGAGIIASGRPRSELFVTTKLKKLPEGVSVRDSVVESLQKLKTNYIDLLLIHVPTNFPGRLKETWKELEALKAEGLTRSIGVSNFGISTLKEIMEGSTIVPAVNQVEFHAHVYEEFRPLLEFAKEHNIVIESFGGLSPLFRVKNSPVVPVVEKIAKSKAKVAGKPVTTSQILLLWLKQKGIVAITTSTKVERVEEYLAVDGVPELTAEEIAEIDAAGAKEHHRHFTSFYNYNPAE
ncbi:Aldo/keto reductase [Vararia minispora EC-137]|uniref:Aldo/keto reductase n=1 Tax=Vararia minispora EC-137 TaxID=1314806 RepID=A0ACB8QKK2_9AGAM|nr:Aldo/keto reductase [Vararia minispora EC-137]